MLFLNNPTIINAAGGNCDVFCVGLNRGNGEVDRGQYNSIKEVFYANGGVFLFKKQIWREVGSFDERFFMYGEDLDWCWRARLMGYSIIYVPHSRVYHRWRGSRAASMAYMLERSWLSTILKNFSLITITRMMPKYLILKTLKTAWLFKNGKSDEKLAIFKAIFWNIINLRATWRKRVQIQASRKLSDTEIKKHLFKQSFEISLWLKKMRHPILSIYKDNW
jgi:GT2 family glycosyltransferase